MAMKTCSCRTATSFGFPPTRRSDSDHWSSRTWTADVTSTWRTPLATTPRRRHLGRGLATGGLDEDGDEDIVLSNLNEPVELLASESLERSHSLVVRVIGRESCRTAVGAVAVATVRGRKLMRQIRGGSSYASSSDTRLFFGCGDVQVVEELLVTWTSGRTVRLTNIPCDQVVTVLEPKDK